MPLVFQIALGVVLGFYLIEVLPHLLAFGAILAVLAIALFLIVLAAAWLGWQRISILLVVLASISVYAILKTLLDRWLKQPRQANWLSAFKYKWKPLIDSVDHFWGMIYLACQLLYLTGFLGLISFVMLGSVLSLFSFIGFLPQDWDKNLHFMVPLGMLSVLVGLVWAGSVVKRKGRGLGRIFNLPGQNADS